MAGNKGRGDPTALTSERWAISAKLSKSPARVVWCVRVCARACFPVCLHTCMCMCACGVFSHVPAHLCAVCVVGTGGHACGAVCVHVWYVFSRVPAHVCAVCVVDMGAHTCGAVCTCVCARAGRRATSALTLVGTRAVRRKARQDVST